MVNTTITNSITHNHKFQVNCESQVSYFSNWLCIGSVFGFRFGIASVECVEFGIWIGTAIQIRIAAIIIIIIIIVITIAIATGILELIRLDHHIEVSPL